MKALVNFILGRKTRANAINPTSGKKQICIIHEENGVEKAKFADGSIHNLSKLKEVKRFD